MRGEDSAGLRKFIWDGENIFRQTDSVGWMRAMTKAASAASYRRNGRE